MEQVAKVMADLYMRVQQLKADVNALEKQVQCMHHENAKLKMEIARLEGRGNDEG